MKWSNIAFVALAVLVAFILIMVSVRRYEIYKNDMSKPYRAVGTVTSSSLFFGSFEDDVATYGDEPAQTALAFLGKYNKNPYTVLRCSSGVIVALVHDSIWGKE